MFAPAGVQRALPLVVRQVGVDARSLEQRAQRRGVARARGARHRGRAEEAARVERGRGQPVGTAQDRAYLAREIRRDPARSEGC